MPKQQKKCSHCKQILPIENFWKNKRIADGYAVTCIQCRKDDYYNNGRKEYFKNYKRKHPFKRRGSKLWRKYKLTLEQYDEMFEQQNGKCAICSEVSLGVKRLCVDHNHKTGKVRGLLCNRCNIKLGIVEDVGFIYAANLYLKATDS